MERRKKAEFEASGVSHSDPEWSKVLPLVWEHLTSATFSDGTVRVCSTVTLFAEGGLVKVCLNDREEECTGWATGGTVKEALRAMEKALSDGTVDWRPSRRLPGRGGQKGK